MFVGQFSMNPPTASPINSTLIETLTQIILALSEQERQILLHQLQDPNPTDRQNLQQKIAIGAQQLLDGDYTEYTDETLPELLAKIRSRIPSDDQYFRELMATFRAERELDDDNPAYTVNW
jgi:hypothetical protein